MSNRITIEPTKFTNIRTGKESLGVRVYDDYGQAYDNCWDSIPDNDMDLLYIVLGLSDDYIADAMESVELNQTGLIISGNWYDWEEIAPTFEKFDKDTTGE